MRNKFEGNLWDTDMPLYEFNGEKHEFYETFCKKNFRSKEDNHLENMVP